MYVVSMTSNPDRLPRKFHRQADDTIVCPHRDLSCCPACVAEYENLRSSMGVTYWMTEDDVAAFCDLCEITRAEFDAMSA